LITEYKTLNPLSGRAFIRTQKIRSMLRFFSTDRILANSKGVSFFILFILAFFISRGHTTVGSTTSGFAGDKCLFDNSSIYTARPDTGGGILPLHNFSLSVTLKENIVQLKWLAENEMNTERFVIQRSTDGANYTDIGFKNPSGPINILTEYNATDDIFNLPASIVYYRVKAEDNRANYAFSNIVPVRLLKISGINLWPNPFTTDLKISYDAPANSTLDIHMLDNSGRVILNTAFSVNRGMNQLSLPGVGKLPSGFYFIRITDKSNNEIFAHKISK
jgi:hypothetical protein